MVTVSAKKTVPTRRVISSTKLGDSAAVVERTEGENINLKAVPDEGEKVTVVVPKSFVLTLDDHTPVQYHAGVQEMSVDHASHWFARAQGVKVYSPDKE